MTTSTHLISIQFLRFIAALMVVLFHSTQTMSRWLTGGSPPGFLRFASLGEAGVHIFFVISGFVMVYTSFAKGRSFSMPSFVLRRVIRIFPIYIIYVAIYVTLYWAVGLGKNLSVLQFLGSVLLLPGFSSLVIGPGWTLSYEMYFYIWFAVLMCFGMATGIAGLSVFFIGSVALGTVLKADNDFFHLMTNPLLIEFLMGAWIGFAVVRGVKVGRVAGAVFIAISLLCFVVGACFSYDQVPRSVAWGLPSALLVAGFIIADGNGQLSSHVKRLSYLGDSSYSLYLLHILLIDLIIWASLNFGIAVGGSAGASKAVICVVSLVTTGLCVAVAAASYELSERRIIVSLQGLLPRLEDEQLCGIEGAACQRFGRLTGSQPLLSWASRSTQRPELGSAQPAANTTGRGRHQ